MTLDQLRAFLQVADLLNMRRAAEALNLTQPAVSAAIAALEGRYRVRLFHRIGRHLELSETGRAFLPEARAVVQQADVARRILEDLTGLRRGEIRLFASQTVASYWLPPRMAHFAALYPTIDLPLKVGNTAQVIEAVLSGTIPIGLVEGSVESPALAQTVLTEDHLGLFVAPTHPLAKTPPETIDHTLLQQARWVLREHGSGTRNHFATCLTAFGLSLDDLTVRLELPSNGAVLAAAEASSLIAVVSTLAAQTRVNAGTIVSLPVPLPARTFSLVTHRERHLSPACQAFIDFLVPIPDDGGSM